MQYEVVDNLYVMDVEEVQTESQTAIVRNFYDMLYHAELSYAAGKVKAEIKNYLGQLQKDYADPIIFEYDGSQMPPILPILGVAQIDFAATVPGNHVVKTANERIRNGEVTIRV